MAFALYAASDSPYWPPVELRVFCEPSLAVKAKVAHRLKQTVASSMADSQFPAVSIQLLRVAALGR